MPDLSATVLAAGALGTAAFGIVEGLKWTRLGEAGFSAAVKLIGPLKEALVVAYGSEYETMLRGQYRGDSTELVRVLRQGVRVGLTPQNVDTIAKFVGSVDKTILSEAVEAIDKGEELTPQLRNAVGRYELAADARIDAAVTIALGQYAGATRIAAAAIALLIAELVGPSLGADPVYILIVGIIAVPLAPIAKDVASAIQAATQALRSKV